MRKKRGGPSLDMDERGDPKREGFGARMARDHEAAKHRTCSAPSHVYASTRRDHLAGRSHNPEWCPICLDGE